MLTKNEKAKVEQIKKLLAGMSVGDRWTVLLAAAPPHQLDKDLDGQYVVYTDCCEKKTVASKT